MKQTIRFTVLALTAWCSAGVCQGSDEVVVTGSRSSWHDLSETPAISITKPGDFGGMPELGI